MIRVIQILATVTLLSLPCAASLATPEEGQEGEPWYEFALWPVHDLFFLDSQHGWITLSVDAPSPYLLRTRDGGRVWERIELIRPLHKVFFLDVNVGFGLSYVISDLRIERTDLFHTKDGGATWSFVSTIAESPSNGEIDITDFLFLDANRGLFVGQAPVGEGFIVYTDDGGRSVSFPSSLPFRLGIAMRIFSDDKKRLWVFGKDAILFSDDQGETWRAQVQKDRLPAGARSILFQSGWIKKDGRGWAVGSSAWGIVLRTDDSGQNWRLEVESSDSRHFDDVWFQGEFGCAVGQGVIVLCTENGGKAWQEKPVLPPRVGKQSNSFKRIVVLTQNHWLLLRNGGFLYQTQDGGKTWQQLNLVSLKDQGKMEPIR